ncbi:MAG: nuclear transport factor 2 family protein [Chitinophagaceae bacterium]|nr:nuclear transport factor 2 family protein [Chitinophagaceae bacterium]
MKALIPALFLLMTGMQSSYAQQPSTETVKTATNNTPGQQAIINISKQKWNWMADKNADSLNLLFDDKSMFVHMGGSWGKEREIEVIKSGGIWYKKAEVYSVIVNIIGSTAILLNDIDLEAVVGGNTVTNPFMVTEVYIKENGVWKMGSLTFSRLLRPVKMNSSNNQQLTAPKE